MPIFDFRCANGHVHDRLVKAGTKSVECPECGNTAEQVWLSAPKLDWAGMAMGESAGPEFIARFEKSHKQRREQEERTLKEHGDRGKLAGS